MEDVGKGVVVPGPVGKEAIDGGGGGAAGGDFLGSGILGTSGAVILTAGGGMGGCIGGCAFCAVRVTSFDMFLSMS